MSTDPEARRVTNDPPGQEEPEVPNYIARSVAAKTHWLQRVLSPWARRWLEPGGATAGPGRKHSQTAMTVGNTQRLVGHVQRLVERSTVWQPEAVSLQPAMVDGFASSIVNRFPDAGAKYELRPAETGVAQAADLVLAGAGTGEPAPASARPGGQSFQPFTSLEEFRKAVEAKQRASEDGPAAVEPPRASQPVQPQVQRTPAEPPKARRLARTLPPGSRPVSRVEEVLSGVEAAPKAETTLQTQAEPEAPPAAGVEPPRPPTVQRQATEPAPAQPPHAEEASPAAQPKMPGVQRQPESGPAFALGEEAAPARPLAGVEPPRPPAGRQVTPPAVQRQAAEAAPGPAQPSQVEEASPVAATPPARLDMPLAQRQLVPALGGEPPAVEAGLPGPLPAPEMLPVQRRVAEEAPAQVPPHAEAGSPAVQRQGAEAAPIPAQLPREKAAPPAAEAGPPDQPALPYVQRQVVGEAPAQAPGHAEAGPPAVQRQGAEAAPIPAQLPREKAAPPAAEAGPPDQPALPYVQRRVVGEAAAPAPAYAGPEPAAPLPAGLDKPLVRRQPVEAPSSRKEEAPPAALEMPLVQRQGTEIESPTAPVIETTSPSRLERPLAQRQPAVTTPTPAQQSGEGEALPDAEARPPAPPVIEKAAPAGPEMPSAQRQAAEATPIPAQPPRQEEAPPPVEVGLPVAPVIEAAAPRQGLKMPLVQRQSAVTPPAPAPLPQEEESPSAAEAKPPGPPADAEMPPAAAPAAFQARPELPLVQRPPQEGIPQVEAGPAQVQRVSAPGEPAAGLEGEIMARAASRARLPLVEPPPPTPAEVIHTKPVEQTAILPQARAQARHGGSAESPASTPSRPGTPPESGQAAPAGGLPAQSGWAQAAASELPLPPVLQRGVAPARPVSTALIQRQPEAPAPSSVVTLRPEPWREGIVQRAEEGEPPAAVAPPPQPPAGESTPANLDTLARQIYPLIKRMLAVERERKLGR